MADFKSPAAKVADQPSEDPQKLEVKSPHEECDGLYKLAQNHHLAALRDDFPRACRKVSLNTSDFPFIYGFLGVTQQV